MAIDGNLSFKTKDIVVFIERTGIGFIFPVFYFMCRDAAVMIFGSDIFISSTISHRRYGETSIYNPYTILTTDTIAIIRCK